jgi:hypothetical protein
MHDHEKLSEVTSHRRLVPPNSLLLFLGAIAGGAGTFWSYKIILGRFSIIFPPDVILTCLIFGAFFGFGASFVSGEYDRLRWLALAIAVFTGVLIPIVAYVVLSLLAGPT